MTREKTHDDGNMSITIAHIRYGIFIYKNNTAGNKKLRYIVYASSAE